MSAFLQVAVAQAAIAISVFNLMIYLWLGLTVLLNGNRQSRVTWVGGIGLLAAALFFLCHGALVGAGVPGWACSSGRLVASIVGAGVCRAVSVGGDRAALRRSDRRVAAYAGASALQSSLRWGCSPRCSRFPPGRPSPATATSSACSTPRCACITPRRRLPPAHPRSWRSPLAFVVYVAACACLPWISLALIQRARPRRAQLSRASPRARRRWRAALERRRRLGAFAARAADGLTLHALHWRGGRADRRTDLRRGAPGLDQPDTGRVLVAAADRARPCAPPAGGDRSRHAGRRWLALG